MSKAFCPEKQVEGNPVLEICKYVVFPELKGKAFLIERPEKFGGNLEFACYKELEDAFVAGLHPLDVKNATGDYVNMILEPVRSYFEKHQENYRKMKDVGIIQ
jgi:tyrosyl-tRNA synthetase